MTYFYLDTGMCVGGSGHTHQLSPGQLQILVDEAIRERECITGNPEKDRENHETEGQC